MRRREKVLDDIARLAGGVAGFAHTTKTQIRQDIKERIDNLALEMDLVPRSEFERLEAVLTETRKQLETLQQEIKTLKNKRQEKA